MDQSTVRRSPLTHEIIEPRDSVGLASTHNRQLFNNSELADHAVTEAEWNDPDRLFAGRSRRLHDTPNLAIISEKPEHRMIIYLKAQGLSNKEVAEKTGYTPAWLSQLTRQPWFRLRLVTELKDAGVDRLQSVLKSTALDSIFTLIDLRDDATAPKAVRRACADSLLDRWLGKATQKIETDDGKRLPTTPEIQALNSELKSIEDQLQEPTPNATNAVTTN